MGGVARGRKSPGRASGRGRGRRLGDRVCTEGEPRGDRAVGVASSVNLCRTRRLSPERARNGARRPRIYRASRAAGCRACTGRNVVGALRAHGARRRDTSGRAFRVLRGSRVTHGNSGIACNSCVPGVSWVSFISGGRDASEFASRAMSICDRLRMGCGSFDVHYYFFFNS